VPVAAHFAESIVHLLLDHWRVYRYVYTDPVSRDRHALSIWKQTGVCIDDADYQAVYRGLRSMLSLLTLPSNALTRVFRYQHLVSPQGGQGHCGC
jgi:hypothetical protein